MSGHGKHPNVSVIIPSYNQASFLRLALESVLRQTCSNWEAIVVDNHSQDNTDEILGEFDDSRIKSFKIHNQGVIASSRNYGIRKSKGDYISFLDSDDEWLPTKMGYQLAVFKENEDLLLVSTGWNKIDDRGELLGTGSRFVEDEVLSYSELAIDNHICNSSTMVKREVFDTLGLLDEDPELKSVEDFAYWMRILSYRDRSAFVIKDPLTKYRIHGQNISQDHVSGTQVSRLEALFQKQIQREECPARKRDLLYGLNHRTFIILWAIHAPRRQYVRLIRETISRRLLSVRLVRFLIKKFFQKACRIVGRRAD